MPADGRVRRPDPFAFEISRLKTTYHKYLADLFAPRIEANEAAKADEESVSP
jgi:hypothetical protein